MDINKKKILVFDLEVAAFDFETYFDEETREYLIKYAKDDEERVKAIESLVFTPYASQIVAIGMLDYNKKEGAVLVNGDSKIELDSSSRLESESLFDYNIDRNNNEEVYYQEEKLVKLTYLCESEKTIIEWFWNKIRKEGYNMFVTFNGREFDCPFIMLRSLALKLRPSYNLMAGSDFNINSYHIDLMKELTFNKHSPQGARRKFSLDFYCKQFGIKSPKEEGVKGDMVKQLYEDGQLQTIADYCFGDVIATSNLFNFWNRYLDFTKY